MQLLNLLIKCPLEVPVDDCPFESYWSQTMTERFAFLETLDEKTTQKLLDMHQRCFQLYSIDQS